MPKTFLRLLSLTLILGCAALHAAAQAFSTLSGTVSDPSKGVIGKATVTLKNSANGSVRTTTTSASGFYSFPSVDAGVYTLRVESAGFQTYTLQNVTLKAAATEGADVVLTVGSASESVNVNADTVMLDSTDASLGDTINEKQIQELPINGRDYARLSLLTPGAVARSRYIADLSFDGLHSVHNQYSIDGIDATRVDQPYMANGYERGSRLLTGSMETIQEFRAQTSGYPSEYGRAAGSLINIVTKSGTNKLHGEFYDFFRNDALDSRNYFAPKQLGATKPEFRYNDFGANISGPVWKDHTFFFANYEGSRQIIGIIANGSVLSNSARTTALTAHPELAPLINAMPTVNDPTAATTVLYRTVSNTNVSENTGSIRVDHKFGEKDSFFVRANINDSLTFGPLFGVTTSAFGINDHQNVPLRTTNIAISEQHQFNSHFINDYLMGLQRWASRLESAEPIPQVSIAGLDIAVGTRGNSLSNNNSFQWGDQLTLVHGRHTIKWGGNIYRIQLNAQSITTATISYGSIANFLTNTAQSVSQTVGNPGHGTRATQYGGFVQDSWQLRPNLTVNYGLRYDFSTNPHDKFSATQSYDPRTGQLMAPGHDYYQENYSDYSPRLGVAYSPTPRTVLKASGGMFYQAYPVGFGSYNVPQNNIPGSLSVTASAAPGLSYPYTSYLANATAATTVYGFPSHKPDIYSIQWNASIARDLGKGTAIQVAYVGNHGVNLWRQENPNTYFQNTTTRPNPRFGSIFLQTNTGFAVYHGLNTQVKQRVGRSLNTTVNYTYGHQIDDVQDQGLYGSDPQDLNNIRSERANGSGDVRHNASFSLVYELPMGDGHAFLGSSPAIVRKVVSGWNINSLGIFRAGVTSSVTMSGINTYGNSNFTAQRPDVTPGVSRYVAKSFYDPTHSNNFTFLNRAAYKCPGSASGLTSCPTTGVFGNSSRNNVTGPRFNQLDLSLVKDTKLGERTTMQFRAELFNILNHPNFGFPNVAWTPTSGTFGTINSTFGNTLGFGASRQIQFALKFMF